jgi:hypothetical protein
MWQRHSHLPMEQPWPTQLAHPSTTPFATVYPDGRVSPFRKSVNSCYFISFPHRQVGLSVDPGSNKCSNLFDRHAAMHNALAANNSVAGNPVDPSGITDLLSSTAIPFAIQWTGLTGPTSTRRDTAIEALEYATELLGKDRSGVVIIDLAENGKAYAPADFAQFYLDHGK